MIRPILPTDPVVQLKQGSSEDMTMVRRSQLDQSQHMMLGVIRNPNGDFGDHTKFLKAKADAFAHRLLSPSLSSEDVRIFHRSTYIPSIQYGLSAVALDEETLGHVQSKVVQSILKKWKVQSTITTAIQHGPAEYGGLDIYDLCTEAGLEAIKFFRDAVYTGSENRKLLFMNLHYSQIEAGIGEQLLENQLIHLSYLTPTWLMSLRQFLHNHNITIKQVSEDFTTPLQGPNALRAK